MRTMTTLYGKDIRKFISGNGIPKGRTEYNGKYQGILDMLAAKCKRNTCTLYFLHKCLNIPNALTMMKSNVKVKNLIQALWVALKDRQLTEEWLKTFNMTIKSINKRQDFIWRIIKENLYLTEYYPYFEETGYDQLREFEMTHDGDVYGQLAVVGENFKKWAEANPEKIEAHMKEVKPLKDALEAEKIRNEEKDKAEKEARKAERKAETEERKEIRHWKQVGERAERKIEREFRRYYK